MEKEEQFCPILKKPCLKEGCTIYYPKGGCCALITMCDLFEDFQHTLLFQKGSLYGLESDNGSHPVAVDIKRLKFLTEQVVLSL